MFKIGQRICLNYDMKSKGVITEIKFVKPSHFLTNGTAMDKQICVICLDNGQTIEISVNDIRPEW